MDVKKMFASLTGVLMLATTVAPMATGAAFYGAELEGAYKYAFEKKITTMSSIDSANMYGQISRVELAKMISNWAEAELGRKADATKVCSFSDENTVGGDLAMYVKKVCQMGLMGEGLSAFRPHDKVTRAEFGTTLSRALWGDKYNEGTPYYAKHLAALKDAGIMKMIETPTQMEIRGYVMLMLQRATASKDASNCADPVVDLACKMGGENCPAACKADNKVDNQGTEKKEGSLEVDVLKTANVVSVPAKGVVSIGDVKFDAAGANITLKGISLERIGLGNNTSVKGVWFEKNGVRVSNKGYLSSDSTTAVSFNPAVVLKASENLELVVELNGEVGAEHAFKVNAIESSAANLSVKNNTTVTVRTTDYKVASVKVGYPNSTPTYNMEEGKSYELGKIKIENISNTNQKKVIVKSMLLRNEKNADVANLYDIVLYRNGKKVSETAQTIGSREILLTMNDVISSAQSATYSLEAKVKSVDSSNGDEYLFDLRRSEDMTVVEEGTNFRSAISLENVDAAKFYTIKGGKILFVSDTSLAKNQTVAQEASDVVLLKGTINPKEPVILRDLKLDLTATTTVPTSAISKIQAKVGNTVINGSFVKNTSDEKAKNLSIAECARREVLNAPVALATVKTACNDVDVIDAAARKIANFTVVDPLTFAAADEVVRKVQVNNFVVATNEVFFDGDFYVNGKSDVEVLVSFNSNAVKGNKIQLGNLKLTSFKAGEYQKSQNNIETDGAYNMKGGNGFIAARTITIGDAKLNLTKTSGLTNPKIVNGSSNSTVVYEGTLRNSGIEKLRITNLSLAFNNTAKDEIDGSAIVTIGDQSFGPQDLKLDKAAHKVTVDFGNIGFDLEAGKTQTIKVAFMLDAIASLATDINFTPSLTVKVADLQGVESPAIQDRNLGKVVVSKDADIQFGSSTVSINNSLVKVNEEQLISKFSLTNKNAQTTISEIQATFDANPTQVVFNVYDANKNAVVSEYVTPKEATPTIANVKVTDNVLESNKAYTVEVLATFGTAAAVNMTKLEFAFDNGALVDTKQTSTINVVSTFPKVTLVPTANKEEILAFEVEAQGDDKVNFDLDGAAVSVAGFDAATWNKAVVKVDGVEVNPNNATKSVEVPANSTVRVAIERGTMDFKGDATKGVLKLIALSTFKIKDAAALGGKLSSTNAANVVFKKLTDGSVVRVDWSDLRGEYSF